MTTYRRFSVPVDGGDLTVGEWTTGAGARDVLAIHGITASHMAWPLVAGALADSRVIAPDLRGRGGSRDLPGPWGMPRHVDDLVAVLDAAGIERCLVAGHSMGAFAAVSLARHHPDRVAGLVLIDGGLPIPLPAGVTERDLPEALIGPAAERLAMTFDDVESYRRFWQAHPAFAANWNQTVQDYVDYDLIGAAPELHPSSIYAAVAEDSRQLHGDAGYVDALEALAPSIDFLRAPRGLLDQVPPLYPDEQLDRWRAALPGVRASVVDDVNHYTIIMTPHGVAAVVDAIERALSIPRTEARA